MENRRLFRRTLILLAMLAAIIYTLFSFLSKDERKVAAVGEAAPDFVLKDLEGKEYRLSDFRGKGVFLNFWGTYCPPCKKEMPYIDHQYDKYKELGVEVIAVNVGETDLAVETFAKRYGLSFPIVVDRSGEVQQAYGVIPLPATFLIDADGKIVDYITGEMTESMVAEYMERIRP